LSRKIGLALSLAAALAEAAPAADGQRVESIELRGVHAYGEERVQRIVRVRPHEPLRRSPEAIAATLETRYHDDGYPAATVTARYDADSGRLVLVADEGRLAEVAFEGLSPRAARNAGRAVHLDTGKVLREDDILEAFDRLESASDGALRFGESRVEETPDGARLVLAPRRSRLRLSPLFGGQDLHPVYPWNRVDGLSIPFGGELTVFDLASFNHLEVYGVGFYATSADTVRYVLGADRPVGPNRLVTVGYEHHDLTDTDDLYRSFDLSGAGGTAIYFEKFANYFRRRGDEAYLFLRASSWGQIGMTFRSDRYDSLPVTTGSSDPNEPVTQGQMRSLVATLRIDPGGLLLDRSSERSSHLRRSLYGTREAPSQVRLEASLEMAGPGVFGGDFDFRRLVAGLRGRVALGSRAAIDARGVLGLSGGTLPVQKRFVLGGVGTLRGYPDRSFSGDRLGQITTELRVDTGRWLPRVIGYYDGGEAWSDGDGEGWKSSAGLGVQWPATTPVFVRIDLARPLGDAGRSDLRSLFRLQIPF
jgi:Omp85 superfamily domain